MKLRPRSIARLSAWIDSSSSAPPHCAPPMPQAPYPISDTSMPVLPSGRYSTASDCPWARSHERDRGAEARLACDGRYAPPRLDRLARLAERVAQGGPRLGEVLDQERNSPQARGPVRV